MAVGHGYVYSVEFGWQYDSNNDVAPPCSVDLAGVWSCLQFHMRHFDIGGTIYTMVAGRNIISFDGGNTHRDIWCYTRAGTFSRSVARTPRTADIRHLDGSAGFVGSGNHLPFMVSLQNAKFIFESSNTASERVGIWMYKWNTFGAFIIGGQIRSRASGADNHRSTQSVQ
jgi:hypothetical protein